MQWPASIHLGFVAVGIRGCSELWPGDGWWILWTVWLRHRPEEGQSVDTGDIAADTGTAREWVAQFVAVNCTVSLSFPSVLWHCWLGDRKCIRPVKCRVLVCWWWHSYWSFFAHLIAAFVTTTSITLGSNKVQNGDVLVSDNPGPPGKWPLKHRELHCDDFGFRAPQFYSFWGFTLKEWNKNTELGELLLPPTRLCFHRRLFVC